MKKIFLTLMLFSLCFAIAQPKDPSGDPDTVRVSGPPGDPTGDPDQRPEFVCDSVYMTKKVIILYYGKKQVAIIRKEEKVKATKKGWYSFY